MPNVVFEAIEIPSVGCARGFALVKRPSHGVSTLWCIRDVGILQCPRRVEFLVGIFRLTWRLMILPEIPWLLRLPLLSSHVAKPAYRVDQCLMQTIPVPQDHSVGCAWGGFDG